MTNPTTDPGGNPLALPPGLRLLQRVEFPRKLGICERLFGASLARQGIRWVRTAPGPMWKLDLANPTHRWTVYGSYEGPALWRWLRARAGAINTVVDSGANIGQTVLYFAALLPGARILAYEPGRLAREWLAACVAANGFKGVVVERAGLSDARGGARLGNVGGDELHGAWNQVNPAEGEAIELATLDEELDRHGIAALDLWKLDVEGYELQALRGAERSLAARRIRAIFMELGSAQSESAALLAGHGYTGWDLADSGRLTPLAGDRRSEWGNALFLPPG
jgi:FkbM family methyltransferase